MAAIKVFQHLDEWEVWVEAAPEDEFQGICIGAAPLRSHALGEAELTLESLIEELKALPID